MQTANVAVGTYVIKTEAIGLALEQHGGAQLRRICAWPRPGRRRDRKGWVVKSRSPSFRAACGTGSRRVATGDCVAITFIPTVLPKGVEPSTDPMLAARAAPYVVGLGRRLGEGAKQ